MGSSFIRDGDCVLASHSSGYLGVMPPKEKGNKKYPANLILERLTLLIN